MPTPDFNFLIYKTAEEDITVNAVIRDETIWLTQKAMAELFGVQAPAISKHLNNIYEEGELLASSTISKMEIVPGRREAELSSGSLIFIIWMPLFPSATASTAVEPRSSAFGRLVC